MKIPLKRDNSFGRSVLVILGVFFAYFLIGAVIIQFIGSDPLQAYKALLSSSLGNLNSLTNVFTRATPLVLSGLSVAVAFKAGIYNLGGEGQIYLGAFAAALVGFSINQLPGVIHLPLTLLAASLAGTIGVWLPAWLRIQYEVDEIISTLLMTPVYILFTNYLANGPFRDPERWSGTTPQIHDSAKLPIIWSESGLNLGIVISIIIALVFVLVMSKTDIGYRWKMIGLNKEFARYGGVQVRRDQMVAMLVSGALAGLAGGLLVCGSQYRFWTQIGGGIGWDGILITLLAKNNPLGVIIWGLAFATVKTGSLGMETASNVPSELTNVLLAMLILLVTGRHFFTELLNRSRKGILNILHGETSE